MWFTEKIKNKSGTIIIITFIIIVSISKFFTDKIGDKNLQDTYKSEYKGIVLKKYEYRGLTLIYKNLKTYEESPINATEILYENSNIGDTIIKIPNSNLCIIKNKCKSIKVECYYME
jgi:hypothetical protein